MVINGKIIQECTKKVARISMEFSLDFAKAHPVISSTTIFLLLLYLYIPGLFWFIVCSAGFVSVAKIYINIKNANAKNAARTDDNNNDSNSTSSRKLVRHDAHARSVRRRRPRELPQSEEEGEEKKTICSSNVEIAPPVEDKTALIEEAPKVIREVKVETAVSSPPSAAARGQTSPALNRWRSLRLKKFSSFSRKGDLEFSDSDDDDERDKEENKKAVQWNENDQKNLADLGLSEIERNQRLESLIARRKARKMFSLQVRRTLMNMDRSEPYNRINPIQVSRANHFNSEKHNSGQFSPMPGSAPSYFRPNNPFDLPYEPQEEKPILTGGSFHQEFDLFAKHENFNLGSHFPGEKFQDEREEETLDFQGDRSSISRIRENLKMVLGSDENDKIIEVESSSEQQPDPSSEIDTFTDCVLASGPRAPHPSLDLTDTYDFRQIRGEEEEKKSSGEAESGRRAPHPSMDLSHVASSSDLGPNPEEEDKNSSEEEEDDEDDMAISRIDRAAILETLASPLMQRNFSFKEEISRNENKMDDPDRFFFSQEGMYHKQNVSIASDLQVECSEIGSSPPLSPHGEEERIESRLRDIHEVGNAAGIELSDEQNRVEEDEKMIQQSSNENLQTFESLDVPPLEQDFHPSEEDNPAFIEEPQTIFHPPDQPVGANYNSQSSQDYELQATDQEASLEANESSRFLPRSIVQHLNAAPYSSSPRSVLQPKFSMDPIPRSPSNLSEELQDETRDTVPLSRGLLQGSDAEILREHSDPTSTSIESSAQEETNSRNHEHEHEPGGNIDASSVNDADDEIKEVDHIASMVTQKEALQPPGTERPAQEN